MKRTSPTPSAPATEERYRPPKLKRVMVTLPEELHAYAQREYGNVSGLFRHLLERDQAAVEKEKRKTQ